MRRAVIGVLAVGLLAGCSHDADRPATPVSLPSAAPAPSGTVDPPVPGAAATTAPATAPQATRTRRTASPSRPGGRPAPPVEAKRNAWVTATVTRVAGSCYAITTADGVQWALYAAAGPDLTAGAHIRARLTPGRTKVDCGEGRPGTLERVQIAG